MMLFPDHYKDIWGSVAQHAEMVEHIQNKIEFYSRPERRSPKTGVLIEIKDFPLCYWDLPTSNNVAILRTDWERVFNHPEFKKLESLGMCYGEWEHAPQHYTRAEFTSHRCLNQRCVEQDNLVLGDVQVIKNACGEVIASFFESGGSYGISSRGKGDVYRDAVKGFDVCQNGTYYHTSFDFVAVPACAQSYGGLLSPSQPVSNAQHIGGASKSRYITQQ